MRRPPRPEPDPAQPASAEDVAVLGTGARTVALEIPPGCPQLEWFQPSLRWAPRGQILRCVIVDGDRGEPVICIDEHELTLGELGRLLAAQSGLGVRILFVPVEALDSPPAIVIGEP